MAKWTIKNATGDVTLTLEGNFLAGCGPTDWVIGDEAMHTVRGGLSTHHDRVLSPLGHWHTHALTAMHSAAQTDFGTAVGQLLCAAESNAQPEQTVRLETSLAISRFSSGEIGEDDLMKIIRKTVLPKG